MPKSFGVSKRARTSPMPNEAMRVTRMPTTLQRRPRPACWAIVPSRTDGMTSVSSSGLTTCVTPERLRLVDPLEPHLAPEADPGAGTVRVVGALADEVLEDDARVLHVHHSPGLLVDHLLDPAFDASVAPA